MENWKLITSKKGFRGQSFITFTEVNASSNSLSFDPFQYYQIKYILYRRILIQVSSEANNI